MKVSLSLNKMMTDMYNLVETIQDTQLIERTPFTGKVRISFLIPLYYQTQNQKMSLEKIRREQCQPIWIPQTLMLS